MSIRQMPPASLPRPFAGLLLAVCAAGALAGCSGPEIYSAAHLPDEFQATSRSTASPPALSSFAKPAAASDLIDRGDVIEVNISAGLNREDTVAFPVRVDDQGDAILPVIGPVSVAGLGLSEAEAAIRSAGIGQQVYRDPIVTVAIKTRRTHRVTVLGAVNNPGVFELRGRLSDLPSAIAAAGGLSEDAGTAVEIRWPEKPIRLEAAKKNPSADQENTYPPNPARTQKESVPQIAARTVPIDLPAMNSHELDLPDGAVVMVNRRNPEYVQVLGLVNHPNRIEFPANGDLKLLDAIAMAEGVAVPVADKVHILRQRPNQSAAIVIEASIRQAMRNKQENLLLAPGDIISVEQSSATVLMETVRGVHLDVGARER